MNDFCKYKRRIKPTNLTLTRVVFEWWYDLVNIAERENLTLTSVVFEFILHVKAKRHFAYLNLTSVVQKIKAVTKRISQCYSFFY